MQGAKENADTLNAHFFFIIGNFRLNGPDEGCETLMDSLMGRPAFFGQFEEDHPQIFTRLFLNHKIAPDQRRNQARRCAFIDGKNFAQHGHVQLPASGNGVEDGELSNRNIFTTYSVLTAAAHRLGQFLDNGENLLIF